MAVGEKVNRSLTNFLLTIHAEVRKMGETGASRDICQLHRSIGEELK